MTHNSLDKIMLSIMEPTKEAVIELSKISHEQTYKSSDEITKKVLDKYSQEIKNRIGNLQLTIDDLSLKIISDYLLWYCRTRINVKCSNKEINKKLKVDKPSGYLSSDELEYLLGFIMVEDRFDDLRKQAYDEQGNIKDPEAEKIFKIYYTFLQKTSQFPSLREILYRQIGQLGLEYLSKIGILEVTPEGYIILTDHPKVQEVMRKYYRY